MTCVWRTLPCATEGAPQHVLWSGGPPHVGRGYVLVHSSAPGRVLRVFDTSVQPPAGELCARHTPWSQ